MRMKPMTKREYDLFLSYSRADAPVAQLVQLLAADLSDLGVRIWLDQWELVPGQNWGESLKQAMELSGAIGICISPGSTNKWNEEELGQALTLRQLHPRFTLIPILLPGTSPADIPAVLRNEVWV